MLPLQLLPFDVRAQVARYTDTLARDLSIAREEIPNLPDSVLKWDTYADPSTLSNDTWGKVFKDGLNRYTIERVKRWQHSEYQAHVASRQAPYNQFKLTDKGLVEYHAGIGDELTLRSFEGIVEALKEWAGVKPKSGLSPQGAARLLRGEIENVYALAAAREMQRDIEREVIDLVYGKPLHEIGYALEQRALGRAPWSTVDPKGFVAKDAWYAVIGKTLSQAGIPVPESFQLIEVLKAQAPKGPTIDARAPLVERLKELYREALSISTDPIFLSDFVDDADSLLRGYRTTSDLQDMIEAEEELLKEATPDTTTTPDVTISWSPAEGLLIYTSTRAYNEILKKYHLKWSRYHEAWYAQGSKGQNRPPPSIGPDRLKYDLEQAGAVVALEISEPVSDQELAQIRLEKAQRGAEYAESRVGKATAEAEGHFKRGQAIAGRFEFGQPILVGHHSEKKARRDQERIQSASRKSHEAFEKAEHYESKAASLEGIANIQERIASGQTATDLERVEQIVEAVRALKPKKTLGLDRLGIKAAQTTRGRAKVWADFSKDGENVTANIYAAGVNYSGTSLNPMGYEAYPEGCSVQSAAEIVLRGVKERLQQQREASIRRMAEDRRKSVEKAVRKVFETENWGTYRLEPKKVLSELERYVKDRAEHFQALLDQQYDTILRSVGQHTSVADIESALHREAYRLAKEEIG